MRNATSTTTIEIISLGILIVTLSLVSGHFLESSLLITSLYLIVTLWRRNSLYSWLESGKKNELLIGSDLWTDILRRIEIDREQIRKNQEAIVQELNNLQIALSSLKVGLVLTDKTWNLIWWNEIGGALLNLREPDDINSYLLSLLRSPSLKDYVEAKDFSEPLVLDSFIIKNNVVEIFFGDSPFGGHILLVRDISQLKKLNEMRADFIANASHELKTPLTVISGYLETLIDNQLVAGVAQNAIEKAKTQALRMNNIIQDLLMLSELETSPNIEFECFNLRELVIQVQQQTNLLLQNTGKSRTIIKTSLQENWILKGNKNEIFSLLSNLLSNAVRYCPDDSMILIGIKESSNAVSLYVKDNGPGIPEPHIARLTERFYRVDKSHSSLTGGTGLGLSITKHIMERHSGRLEINSKEGEGTNVSCSFSKDRLYQALT